MNYLQEFELMKKVMRALKRIPNDMQSMNYTNYYREIEHRIYEISEILKERIEEKSER